MNGGELAGRVAIVAGGAGGIGSAVCRTLAQRGAAVVVADVNLAQARAVAASLPGAGGHDAVAVDVADGAAVQDAVRGAVAARARIDLLAYCAGNNIKGPSLELSAAQWRSALDSHLTGAFLFSQAVGRHLVGRSPDARADTLTRRPSIERSGEACRTISKVAARSSRSSIARAPSSSTSKRRGAAAAKSG